MLFVSMSDSQFEKVIELLDSIEKTSTGCCVFLGFLFVIVLLVFAIMLNKEFDRSIDRKKRQFADDVREIFLKEKEKDK